MSMHQKNLQHFFFDLDNTLTQSTSPLLPSHKEVFDYFCGSHDVVVVSGASEAQIERQLEPARNRYFILAQNGNVALNPEGLTLWENTLSASAKGAIREFIEKVKREVSTTVRDENDLVQDRGAQISYSLIGHHEDKKTKELFDPDKSKRKKIVERFREELTKLRSVGVEYGIGGTTSIDFFAIGSNKGANVARLVGQYKWKKDSCLYFGDALFPGGNDESVVGVIPTQEVSDHEHTFRLLAGYVKNSRGL